MYIYTMNFKSLFRVCAAASPYTLQHLVHCLATTFVNIGIYWRYGT